MKPEVDIPNTTSDNKNIDYILKPTDKAHKPHKKVKGRIPEKQFPLKVRKLTYLREIAMEAMFRRKVFTIINGNFSSIRTALSQRGWVEKIIDSAYNSSGSQKTKVVPKISYEQNFVSNLVKRHVPDFIWTSKLDDIKKFTINTELFPFINRLEMKDKMHFTSKAGLSSLQDDCHWYYIPGISDVYVPRSFTTKHHDDFLVEYRITACTSLLKWYTSEKNNSNVNIVSNKGTISLDVILFAILRCDEYINSKRNNDILYPVNNGPKKKQWDNFLKDCERLLMQTEYLQNEYTNRFDLYFTNATKILKEIVRFRPFMKSEGHRNVWITKPSHAARGIGIKILIGIEKIINNFKDKYDMCLIQKYIEEPLLIYDAKFDIRQYYVVTSINPLVIWMYKDSYIRFCSRNYNITTFHESIHLTNHAVQQRYTNQINRSPLLPKDNMWSLKEFKEYLNKGGHSNVWDEIIYPGMKRNILGTMLRAQDKIVNTKNRFEFFGCDFLLDQEYCPWLIEINSSPDLRATTQVTEKICPAALTDLIKVVIDHKINCYVSTGNFECIYDQMVTPMVESRDFSDLRIQGHHLPRNYFSSEIEVTEQQYECIFIPDYAIDMSPSNVRIVTSCSKYCQASIEISEKGDESLEDECFDIVNADEREEEDHFVESFDNNCDLEPHDISTQFKNTIYVDSLRCSLSA